MSQVGQLVGTNGAIKLRFEFKREFSLSKNSHFYWIQLNNAIPKVWKDYIYKGAENFNDLTFSGHHIIKKYLETMLTLMIAKMT